ncbi:MAG: FAD-dependent oxidoreductase [Chloroflexi bacterium]|nr:FAD-dependent oxidoreductase [Chloroflexota bacterium]
MTYDTHCCIVGGGPAGMILALLLGRAGIPTTLLEEHQDFERDFRGDTVHPSTMELMDTLGLAERVLELPHAKVRHLNFDGPNGTLELADLSRLPTKFPYITMMPQARFLDFLAGELAKLPSVRLVMGASVHGLLWDDPWGRSGLADRTPDRAGAASDRDGSAPDGATGAAPTSEKAAAPTSEKAAAAAEGHGALPDDATVRGVHYRTRDGEHDLRAPLTIAADGRFSRIRRLGGFELLSSAPPMDVIWFRLPRDADEPEEARGTIGHGHMMVQLNRGDAWQIAFIIPKGGFKDVRAAGLPEFRASIAEMAPDLVDRLDTLKDWRQVTLLSVEAGRVRRWYRPGLLLIGDAAHIMSPVGGVGINYAIQDSVVAANVLTMPLQQGQLRLSHLAAVQRQRELPVRIIQGFQRLAQERIVRQALRSDAPVMSPPPVMRVPILRDLIPRMIALGVWPVHLKA